MKKITLLATAVLLTSVLSAQLAGNSVISRFNQPMQNATPRSWQMLPFNQPVGVKTNISMQPLSATPIRADVMMNVEPSSLVAIFNLKFSGSTAHEADSLMTLKIQALISSFNKIGILLNDIHIDVIGIHPETNTLASELQVESQNFKRNISISKNIHIRFFHQNLMDEIIKIATKHEVFDLVKVDYNVDNMDLIYDSLRVVAERILKLKHDAFVGQGFTLEAQQFGTTQGLVHPFERYASYTSPSENKPEIIKPEQPGKGKKQPPIPAIVKEQAPKLTVYYERVPSNQFDLVIHEDMLAPCVQFYYSLQVNYKVILKDLALKEQEDRELDLALRRAEIKQKIKHAGGNVNIEINTPVSTR